MVDAGSNFGNGSPTDEVNLSTKIWTRLFCLGLKSSSGRRVKTSFTKLFGVFALVAHREADLFEIPLILVPFRSEIISSDYRCQRGTLQGDSS